MRSFINKNRHPFLLIAIFILAEVLVNPLGEFPLNDDWSYTKSVLILSNEGRLDIGEWPAMTLVAHLVWGSLFIKTAGFSFFILRCSTFVASLIGLIVFFKMLVNLTANRQISFFASLTLLICPLYFNLTNTYMTDVNFNTLLILCCYFSLRYFQTLKAGWIIAFTVSSCALVLIRQFGIIAPVCFLTGCLFLQRKRPFSLLLSAICLAMVYFVFHAYESFLKELLPTTASYKFSGTIKITDPEFYNSVLFKMADRWKQVFATIAVYLLPLTVAGVPHYIRKMSWKKSVLIIMLSIAFSLLVFYKVPTQIGNVFRDMSVGAETFYQSLIYVTSGNTHTWSPTFLLMLDITKHAAIAVLFFVSCALLSENYRSLKNHLSSFNIFISVLMAIYIITLFVTESFFDRYTIPAITLALIVISMLYARITFSWKTAVIPIILFAYVSVAGTHDYFTVNRIRWQAYDLLREQAISPRKINAGFEVNCWDEGNYGWWVNILTTDNYDYLVQYRGEPGFKRMSAFPFRRMFPFSKDTIAIYQRQGIVNETEVK